jgi:hypothetical protein
MWCDAALPAPASTSLPKTWMAGLGPAMTETTLRELMFDV